MALSQGVSLLFCYSILSSSGGGFQLGMSVPVTDPVTAAAIKAYIKN